MTVHLEAAGIDQEKASIHLRQSLQRLKKYHERNGMGYSCGWVLENGPVKGVHAHIALHRPSVLPIHPITYWWASLRRFQLPREKGILKIKKFYSWQSYDENLFKVIGYMLEGVRPEAASLLNINYKNQRLIYGKRIGWSKAN